MFVQRFKWRQQSFATIVVAVMVIVLVGPSKPANGQVKFVCIDESTCTWDDASPDLHGVMEGADENDIIWVAQGIYRPDCSAGIECSFELQAGVSIYGNFIGTEDFLDEREPLEANYASILDGVIDPESFPDVKALHVVRVDGTGPQDDRRIDGFTIRNGHARGYVEDCAVAPPSFSLHAYASSGGGMLVAGQDKFELGIVMCRFEDNLAGADMCPTGFCHEAQLCHEASLWAFRGYGGAIAFRGDTASLDEPIVVHERKVLLHNCVFEQNRVATGVFGTATGPVGGALYKDPGFGILEIMNSKFVGNVVDARTMPCCPFGEGHLFENDDWKARGGAMSFGRSMECDTASTFSPSETRIWNCTITGNEVRSSGSNSRAGRGIWSDKASGYVPPASPALPTFSHATSAGPWLAIVNSIVYGNEAYAVGSSTPDTTIGHQVDFPDGEPCDPPYVAYSNVHVSGQSWSYYGTGDLNINANPQFVDASAGDFRLSASSPCIDVGTETGIPLDVLNISRSMFHATLPVPDLNHADRIFGCVPDMGAFEWNTVADLDDDGVVDFQDLLVLLDAWEETCPGAPAPCPGDLNGDDEINFSDMLILLNAWSHACSGSESQMGSIEECITRLGVSNPAALAACIEAMILNGTP